MREKIRTFLKKEYLLISGYVIFTICFIVALSYLITKADTIFLWGINGIKKFLSITAPVFIGAVVAWLFDPIVTWMEVWICKLFKKQIGYSKKSRLIAVLFTFLLLFVLIIGLLVLAIYSISKQINGDGIIGVQNLLSNYIQSFMNSLKEMDIALSKLHLGNGVFIENFEKMRMEMIGSIQTFIRNFMSNTMNLSGIIMKLGLGLILAIYFLIDKNTFILYGNVIGKIFLKQSVYDTIKRWYQDVDRIFSGYIRGQTIDVLFMAVAISVLLGIIGIKYSLLIGCIAGICNYIPYVGPFVAYIGTIGFGLLNGQEKQVLIALVFLFVLQQIDGNYIGPKVMARSVAIEPVFVLIGVIVGGSVLGFIGMIVATPLMALMKMIFVRLLEKRLLAMQEKEQSSA